MKCTLCSCCSSHWNKFTFLKQVLQQNWLLLRQRPYGPQILKYILFSPCWPLAQRKEGLILRSQEGSQEVSYPKCVRRLKRWSLTGWHRGTGTLCHFYSYSLSHPRCTFPHPHLISWEHNSFEFYTEWAQILYPWIRKWSPDLGALKVTFVPKILLPAACIWERHGPWAIPSLWKNRWITRKVSKVARQCHYRPVT